MPEGTDDPDNDNNNDNTQDDNLDDNNNDNTQGDNGEVFTGDLDMGQTAFQDSIGDLVIGRSEIIWKFVSCNLR